MRHRSARAKCLLGRPWPSMLPQIGDEVLRLSGAFGLGRSYGLATMSTSGCSRGRLYLRLVRSRSLHRGELRSSGRAWLDNEDFADRAADAVDATHAFVLQRQAVLLDPLQALLDVLDDLLGADHPDH